MNPRHLLVLAALLPLAARAADNGLDPRGKIHIPIGVANTNDRLKTFVEAEGNFSPGVGSYGVYFWATDPATGKLVAPTMDGVKVEHGLPPGGALIPWAKWSAGNLAIKTEVCHTLQGSPKGDQHSDSVQPPPVSPLPAVLLAVARDDRIASLPTLMAALERDLSRSQSPPKSIVHCCFRI